MAGTRKPPPPSTTGLKTRAKRKAEAPKRRRSLAQPQPPTEPPLIGSEPEQVAPPEVAAIAVSAKPTTKLDAVIAALRAPGGASVPDLVDLTGWAEKSVRGFMAGALKKKRSLTIVSSKEPGAQRMYRIVEPEA